MQQVLCREHGTLCFLKTGTRDGANKGKSFYICGAPSKTPCGYVQVADIPASHCLLHEEYVVELQALIKQQDGRKFRLCYRCAKGKADGKKWCGSIPWQDSTELSENGKSFHSLGKPHPDSERNPFKIKIEDQKPSLWKLDNDEKREATAQSKRDQPPDVGTEKLQDELWKEKGLPVELKIKKKTLGTGEKQTSALEDGARSIDKPQKCCSLNDGGIPQDKLEGWCEREAGKQTECAREERDSEGDLNAQHRKQGTPLEETSKREGKSQHSLHKLQERHSKLVKEGLLSDEQDKIPKNKGIKMKEDHVGKSGREIPKLNRNGAGHKETDCSTLATKSASEDGAVPQLTSLEKCKVATSGTITREKDERAGGCSGTDQGELRKDRPFQEMKPQVVEYPGTKSGGLRQKMMTSFPGFVLASQAIGPGLQDLSALHNHLTAQLKQKKATLASVNVQALPDKGQRLQRQVHEIEDALGSLSLNTPVENDRREAEMKEKQPADVRNPFSSTAPIPQSSESLIKPPVFQDLQSQSLGSASSIGSSQVCGGKPQQQSQYVGRMKKDSLFAVHNATSEAIDHLHKSLESCPSTESIVEDPAGLKVPLLLHQKQALAWLLWRETQKPQGGILADDMGLGKTLTMIALILTQKHREKRDKNETKIEVWISKQDSSLIVSHATLVICPASLIHHWKKEVDKRVDRGKLRVYLYHGPNREKNSQLLSEYDIIVTTYCLVAKEIPVQKGEDESPARGQGEDGSCSLYSPLLRVAWRRIILDEAHTIKNPKAQTSLAVCKLRASARWAVTGTPIQNNLLDMYSLLKFLHCSPFDDFKVWKNQVDNCTKKGGERLIILTMSLLLRRMKDQIDAAGKPLVPLPQRRYRLHHLKLSENEQSVYNVLYARSRSTLQSYLKRHEGGDDKPGRRSDNPFDRVAQEFDASRDAYPSSSQPQASSTMHILTLLLRLRQCCCHLSLLKMTLNQVELKSEGIELSLEEQLSALTLSELHLPDPNSTVRLNGTSFQANLFENHRESTKITALMAELKTIQSSSEAQKSVIVSQWTSMLKVVAVHLKRIGLSYGVVDGSVNPKQRMDLVEEFNNNSKGPQVMLVSLSAGGVGLNLIGGNHLFLLDMHWNPALEDQACDRIYRVGQLKDVVIHRFVCEGTVEEKISALQVKKKELATQVLSGKGEAITKLTLADLKVLFGV